MKVVVTDPNHKNALAACRSLRIHGHEVHTFGNKFSLSNFSRVVTEAHSPRNPTSHFGAEITALAQKIGPSALLPVGAHSVAMLHLERNNIIQHCSFAIAPLHSLSTALNKSQTTQLAATLGLKVPQSWFCGTSKELENVLEVVEGPVVVRSASELIKFGPIYLDSRNAIRDALDTDVFAGPLVSVSLIVQERISGPGEGFFSLYQEGKIKRMMMHERLREEPPTGGSSWVARSIHKEDLFAAGTTLLDSLDWHGPAMVEFKRRSSDGSLFFIELNPKLWGSLDLTVAAGFDVPVDTVRVATGEMLKEDLNFKKNVYFFWPLDSFSSLKAWATGVYRESSTNLQAKDPFPALFAGGQIIARSIWQKIRGSLLFLFAYWVTKRGWAYGFGRYLDQVLGIPFKSYCEISDFLWVGAKPRFLGALKLRWSGRTVIFSFLKELPSGSRKGFNSSSTYAPLTEFSSADPSKLHEITSLLFSAEDRGERVFIHCREGVGRAPMVAAAYFVRKGYSVTRALEAVRRGRKFADLTAPQLASLEVYEKTLDGSGTFELEE